jgi:hypothetical protein
MADHVWDMSLPRDGEFLSSTVALETNDPSVPSKTWASDIKAQGLWPRDKDDFEIIGLSSSLYSCSSAISGVGGYWIIWIGSLGDEMFGEHWETQRYISSYRKNVKYHSSFNDLLVLVHNHLIRMKRNHMSGYRGKPRRTSGLLLSNWRCRKRYEVTHDHLERRSTEEQGGET